MQTMERRSLAEPVEARAEGRKIGGYGAVFNSETVIGGQFREKIEPGAFAKALKNDIRSFFNHDPNLVLGRTKSGTLRIKEDARGLSYEVDLPDTQAGRDVATSMERGDVDGSSFTFRVTDEEWIEERGNLPLRIVREVELYEVGPVTMPAYEDTTVAMRSLDAMKSDREKAEHNAAQARARIAARRAAAEQKFRGIKPE
jgi:hypothetical protein